MVINRRGYEKAPSLVNYFEEWAERRIALRDCPPRANGEAGCERGVSSRPNIFGGYDYSNGARSRENIFGGQDCR